MTTERDGELAILEVQSRLVLGCGLREEMRELAHEGVKCMLLDFSKATEIDSSGLGELVAGHASVTHAGGNTLLLNVNSRTKELLRSTRLSSVFPIYDGAASIVRSILANRSPIQREADRHMLTEVHIG